MMRGDRRNATYGTHVTNETHISPIGPIRVCWPRVDLSPRSIVARQRHEHDHDCSGHPYEVKKESGPEIEHAAPGITNLVVAGRGQ